MSVRPLRKSDLAAAGRVCRTAFGTFLGAADPETFWTDRDYVGSRWRAAHTAAFAAETGGELVGSVFATKWGSVGFLGPLTVRPDLWGDGTGTRLIEAAMAAFNDMDTRHVGLFTFAHSPKHVGLYQKFGFWPRFLTPIMTAPVRGNLAPGPTSRYSALSERDRAVCLDDCRAVADAIYQGLDLTEEIRTVDTQGLGDTVLVSTGDRVAGFAVCHYGPKSEAGAGACFVKFGAVRSGPAEDETFGRLLDACETLAAAQGLPVLVAGVSTARHEAYRHLLARGFRAELLGVTMHRPNEAGYSRPGVYVLDDWR